MNSALAHFRQIVLADSRLFEQLQQASDLDRFAELAVRLGAEHACDFAEQDVREAVREARRVWLEKWI